MATPLKDEDEDEDTVMEERSELMVPPNVTKPTNPIRKLAPFLKPSAASMDTVKPFSLNPSYDPKTSSLKVSFNGFRIPQKGWKDWVNSMCLLHKSTWQKSGIYNAVLNSSYEIVQNSDLILGFAKNWCDETKTFVFKWGEVTVTLEDMMVVGGFSVLGHSVFNLAHIKSDEAKEVLWKLDVAWDELYRSPPHKAEQGIWMKMFKDSHSDIEHEAFLVLWLSRFVFPSTYSTVTKKVFAIAVFLARGVKLALAPPVLASIYRDLSLLKNVLENDSPNDDETKVIVWAPFQLVQIWVWERFRKISPSCSDSYGPRFARWEKKKLRIENVDSGFEDFCWRPYAENLKDKFGRWAVVRDCVDEELKSWVRCLRVSELVGIDVKCIQQYLPHRVAMQFGMKQDVPGDVARVDGSREIAWRFYTRPVKDVKMYIPARVFKPYVTVRYLEWWNKSAGECSMLPPFGDNVTKKIGKNESRSKRSNLSPKHTKTLKLTHTSAPLLKPSAVKSKPCSFNRSLSPKTSTSKPLQPTHTRAPLLKPSAVKSKPSFKRVVALGLVARNVESETQVYPKKPCSFNHSSSPKSGISRVSFNGFRTLQKGWKDWVNSMHSLYKSTWQKAGIYNAVLNSSYEIIKDDDLILQFAKKWCNETNTFVFKWGEVTITLQDMMVVGGYSVLGQSVVNLADTVTGEFKAIIAKLNEARAEMKRSGYGKADQSGWMKKFKDSGSEIEHEAFLVLWLSRFVFPSSYSTVSTNVSAIAVCLSRGIKLALAPSVLASIYKDLSFLKFSLKNGEQNDVIVWAPLQLLQVWIWERFKNLSPNCVDGSGPRFARWEKKKKSIENVDCGLKDFFWQPYAEDSNDKSRRLAVVGDSLDEELESWVRCLRVSELVGMDGKFIMQYLPHRVAMQFGMNQDVPADVARVNESPEVAWRFYTRPVKDVEGYFPSRVSKPYVTVRYLKWWNKSNGEDLQSPIAHDKTENFGKDKSRSEGSKDSADVYTLGLKLEARISILEELFAYLKATRI